MFETAVGSCRKIPKEAGDRNRTSPFAFTGNKFEIPRRRLQRQHRRRQHGAEHDRCRSARLHATETGEGDQGWQGPEQAQSRRCFRLIKESKKVIFSGNNHSEEVAPGSPRRKRACRISRTPFEVLPVTIEPETIALFEKVQVYSEKELRSSLHYSLRSVCEGGADRRQNGFDDGQRR